MSTNETVLIIVTAVAALLLVAVLAGVAYKTRACKRGAFGGSIREEMKAEVLHTARSDAARQRQAARDDLDDSFARGLRPEPGAGR
jgi:hypothetical protein